MAAIDPRDSWDLLTLGDGEFQILSDCSVIAITSSVIAITSSMLFNTCQNY